MIHIFNAFSKLRLHHPEVISTFLSLIGTVGILLLSSCETDSVSEGGNTSIAVHPDSSDSLHSSTPDHQSDAVQTVSSGPKNFNELVELFTIDLVLDEYKKVKMDPLDQLPKFNEANETIFQRFQKKKPTKVDRGMKTYPRFILKSYRFATENAADEAVTNWLNSFDSSADSIALGQEVKAVKSPPLFCALREDAFFILQTSCVYQHESLDSLKERYFNWMEDTGGRMAWEIGCDAGRLTYRFQHDL